MERAADQTNTRNGSESDDLAEVTRPRAAGDIAKERPCMYCGKKFHSSF